MSVYDLAEPNYTNSVGLCCRQSSSSKAEGPTTQFPDSKRATIFLRFSTISRGINPSTMPNPKGYLRACSPGLRIRALAHSTRKFNNAAWYIQWIAKFAVLEQNTVSMDEIVVTNNHSSLGNLPWNWKIPITEMEFNEWQWQIYWPRKRQIRLGIDLPRLNLIKQIWALLLPTDYYSSSSVQKVRPVICAPPILHFLYNNWPQEFA